MDALLENQTDDVRARGNELRRKILQALQFVTGDCIVHDIDWVDLPGMAIGDDPYQYPMVQELDTYGICRSKFSDYVEFMKFRVLASSARRADVDDLSKAVAQLPTGREMLKWNTGGWPRVCVWSYNALYLADSVERPGNKYSRSGLLAQVAVVEGKLQTCSTNCMTEDEILNNIGQHNWLYAACTNACSTWKTLAEKELPVPRLLSQVTARETGGAQGRKRKPLGGARDGKRKSLTALLQRLGDLRE
jgi:hypothetical protein